MSIAQELLAEFEVQVPVTRTFLERVPEHRLTWQPHARSMTAGQLAFHLAVVPGGVARAVQRAEVSPPDFVVPQPDSLAQVLSTFDESIATVRDVLPGLDDNTMHGIWRIVDGDQELLAVPRHDFLRNIMLNHWYQHRGQLCVYLRLLDVAVPRSWGPSADEPVAFQAQPQPA